jgi:hypothetical protein
VANATSEVKKGVVRIQDRWRKRSVETLSAATRFYTTALLGIDSTGYYCKGDDTQSWLFGGVVRGGEGNPLLPAGTAGDGTIDLDNEMPGWLELLVSGVAVTDIGKPVYALFDNEGTLDFAATTYANLVGHVVDVAKPGVSNIALVEPAYDGVAAHLRLQAAKRVAATGATTLSKFDLGKTVFCANSAAKTITLPPIADVPAGRTITIVKDHASDTNILTLAGDGSENIDAANTLTTLDAPWDVATLVSNGARWVVRSRDLA